MVRLSFHGLQAERMGRRRTDSEGVIISLEDDQRVKRELSNIDFIKVSFKLFK
ncbi:MAG: hypothetical protein ACXWEW_05400 [Nitrososphaeraceae archaeon]